MESSGITADRLCREFDVPVRGSGVGEGLRFLLNRSYRRVTAVTDLNFSISRGEVVGLIGPNGAGKTTTMKLLTGVLSPSAGYVTVDGYTPSRREPNHLKNIAFIRGGQPLGSPPELTVLDVLHYNRILYGVARSDFDRAYDQLDSWLGLRRIADRQVRALSLGERMRAGLATQLVYSPKYLFLDEPTTGLDLVVAASFREHMRRYVQEHDATVILTSHHMADVQQLCSRVLVIDDGELRYDGALSGLNQLRSAVKVIRAELSEPLTGRALGLRSFWVEQSVARMLVEPTDIPRVTDLLLDYGATDVSIEDPPLEIVLADLFRKSEP
ncbi:ATP-binding cassette domain-containing protein [Nocardioides sp. SYSU D00038]|uniref:ATP-binding cassette domain-containing protein n=1 Tax=Nocardioides sp. SYSU D00038 TaxID=2812554 RepID=UPI001966EB15|nr:ATP-binding cassette domain-containing protein [Nocardioides sp. SYSU D00038]